MNETVREKLAEYAHSAWSGWLRYMFSKMTINEDGTAAVPKWAVERWSRQMNTEYVDMPENEKESDRAEADIMLSTISKPTGLVRVAKCKYPGCVNGYLHDSLGTSGRCPDCSGTGFIRTDLTADEAAEEFVKLVERLAACGSHLILPDGSRIELKEKP